MRFVAEDWIKQTFTFFLVAILLSQWAGSPGSRMFYYFLLSLLRSSDEAHQRQTRGALETKGIGKRGMA